MSEQGEHTAVGPGVDVAAAIEQSGLPLSQTYQRAAIAEQAGCESLWMIQPPSDRETLTVLGGLAGVTKTAHLGSSIIPMFSRPPVVMAQTALTLDELAGNRLILGLGLGIKMMGEWTLGQKQGPPLRATREYLTIVNSIIHEGEVAFNGQWYSGNGTYAAKRRADLPVYLGTFGPRMMQLAGELADGLILWLCTPEYVRDTVLPNLRAGWARRDRPHDKFSVTIMVGCSLVDDEHSTAGFRRSLSGYSQLPTYRKLFEACGFGADLKAGRASDDMVHALAAIGSPQRVRQRLAEYAAAGVTRLVVSPQVGKDFDAELYGETLRVAGSILPSR